MTTDILDLTDANHERKRDNSVSIVLSVVRKNFASLRSVKDNFNRGTPSYDPIVPERTWNGFTTDLQRRQNGPKIEARQMK